LKTVSLLEDQSARIPGLRDTVAARPGGANQEENGSIFKRLEAEPDSSKRDRCRIDVLPPLYSQPDLGGFMKSSTTLALAASLDAGDVAAALVSTSALADCNSGQCEWVAACICE
jgi:hypothetical protein